MEFIKMIVTREQEKKCEARNISTVGTHSAHKSNTSVVALLISRYSDSITAELASLTSTSETYGINAIVAIVHS